MSAASKEEIKRLDVGKKREWKLQQTINELLTWANYLQMSAEAFVHELDRYSSNLTSGPQAMKKYAALKEDLQELKQKGLSLKARVRRLR